MFWNYLNYFKLISVNNVTKMNRFYFWDVLIFFWDHFLFFSLSLFLFLSLKIFAFLKIFFVEIFSSQKERKWKTQIFIKNKNVLYHKKRKLLFFQKMFFHSKRRFFLCYFLKKEEEKNVLFLIEIDGFILDYHQFILEFESKKFNNKNNLFNYQ